MKKRIENIDELTRELMQSAVETPSPALHQSILARIAQELPYARKKKVIIQMTRPSYTPLLVGIGAVYVVLVGIILFALYSTSESAESISFKNNLEELYPYLLVIAGTIGSLIFYNALDKILRISY